MTIDLQDEQQRLDTEIESVRGLVINEDNIQDKIKAIGDRNLRIELLKHNSRLKIALRKREEKEQELRDLKPSESTWLNFFNKRVSTEIISIKHDIEALRIEERTSRFKFIELIANYSAPELRERVLLLKQLIAEETNKSKTMVKRFNYLQELLDYEAKVRDFRKGYIGP